MGVSDGLSENKSKIIKLQLPCVVHLKVNLRSYLFPCLFLFFSHKMFPIFLSSQGWHPCRWLHTKWECIRVGPTIFFPVFFFWLGKTLQVSYLHFDRSSDGKAKELNNL